MRRNRPGSSAASSAQTPLSGDDDLRRRTLRAPTALTRLQAGKKRGQAAHSHLHGLQDGVGRQPRTDSGRRHRPRPNLVSDTQQSTASRGPAQSGIKTHKRASRPGGPERHTRRRNRPPAPLTQRRTGCSLISLRWLKDNQHAHRTLLSAPLSAPTDCFMERAAVDAGGREGGGIAMVV